MIERKKRKQFGSVVFNKAAKKWKFLWWENGKRCSRTIGTKRDYPTKASAWEAAKPLIEQMEHAQNSPGPVVKASTVVSVKKLLEQYRVEKMPQRASTRRGYET